MVSAAPLLQWSSSGGGGEEKTQPENMGLESQNTWTFKFCFTSALQFPDLDELGLKTLSFCLFVLLSS